MPRLTDLAYALAALVTAPVWLWRMTRTGKIRTDWRGRFGHLEPWPRTDRPRVLLHAVSVGEVNACRLLVDRLAAAPERPEIAIAATTDTGFARASALFADRHRVVRFPFDFSWMVRRFLDAVAPDVVVHAELEVWPNFTSSCRRRGIPICVVNGRISERGMRRYRWVRPLVRPSFARLSIVAAQNETYAERFRALGLAAHDVVVTGTMKWDTADLADHAGASEALAQALGIDRSRPLVVAGSTAPGEHVLLRDAVPPGVQLLCAPRKPEWFDQAAADLPACVRRAQGGRASPTGRYLLDTIGELRSAYALADVVVVGRTFDDLGGSDMMEPVALGKATVVGPSLENFADTARALEEGGGLVRTSHSELAATLAALLADPERRNELGARGRAVIRAAQGATERNAELVLSLLPSRAVARPPVAMAATLAP
ncbi:MAG: hypothetical protein KDA22_15520 [Phycisphaerales bacterium]|nr:hypothetical protein [Phycisphaerales bacterium]